ncbi:hypothetical protein JCM9140_3680 [Halalkalibacter wakoensis JCM 9140]|uniref:CSD domain-containing protein n=1 Tax=Halalkalibacter wakoensis JCM 9140 TaxID=1236970 RepID=W4Q768_9BACI|nr:DUF2357 domain-containing protein [Halalkalibacter wakoensis]GAE27528.1 hypothetical protein JCM9140_3680 [Halalkalibacter wakoensis JCM 9140]
MVPKLPEIDDLERIAASQSPSVEGAWWITLQIVDHIVNSMSQRDTIHRAFVSDLLSDFLSRNDRLLQLKSVRPLPNDTIQQLISYCWKPAEYILAEPRTKMVKEGTMISSHKLKNPSARTMNWLAKQPGRNMREKLAGKNKLLSEKNVYSCDTKENQVTVKVLSDLKHLIEDRMDLGIQEMMYDYLESDCLRNDEMEAFLEFSAKIKQSKLADVDPIPSNQPNNVLMNDKYYSAIWRANQEMIKYKQAIEESWDFAFERYLSMVVLSIGSSLLRTQNVAIVDDVGRVIDVDGYVHLATLWNETIGQAKPIQFIATDDVSNVTVGTVKMLQKDKKFGFIHANGMDYHFRAQSLKESYLFESLQLDQRVTFVPRKESKGMGAHQVNVREVLESISLILKPKTIEIVISQQSFQSETAKYNERLRTTLVYEFSEVISKLELKRGISYSVKKTKNQKFESKWQLAAFADMQGLRETASQISKEILSEFSFRNHQATQRVYKQLTDHVTLDFTTHRPQLQTNGTKVELPYQLCSMVIPGDEGIELHQPNTRDLFDLHSDILSMKSIISTHAPKHEYKMTSFTNVLQKLQADISKLDGYLIYTVPDRIDEFSQSNIKKEFAIHFKKAYPVWRSIAAAIAWKPQANIANARTLLVIDTHEDSSNAVFLKVIENKKVGDFFFEHYAPFPHEDDEYPIHFDAFIRDYLDAYIKKHRLDLTDSQQQALIQSGIVEKAVMNKEEMIILLSNEPHAIYGKVSYDHSVYLQVYRKWLKHLSTYLIKLKDEELGRSKVDHVLFLGDHLHDEKQLTSHIMKVFPVKTVKLVSTEEALKGASEINEQLKNHLPTWYEFLPNLSLEVIKDGHYDQLSLIKDTSIENVMGEVKQFEVKETLTLEKGHDDYKFPLLKGVSGKNNIEFQAMIKDKSFPLQEDVHVKLSINYRYGYENSYELVITPVEISNAPFAEIVAEWLEEGNYVDSEEMYPTFPEKKFDEQELLGEIDIMNNFIGRMYKIIESKLVKQTAQINDLEYMEGQFFKNIHRVRKLVSSDSPIIAKFVNALYHHPIVKFLANVDNFIPEHLQTPANEQTIKKLKNVVLQFLCSFGPHVIPSLYTFVIEHYKESDPVKKARVYGALLTLNGNKNEIVEKVVNEINRDKQPTIRSLSIPLWKDKDMIETLFERHPEFITKIINEITFTFKKIEKQKFMNPVLFRDYCEVLLAILRLRRNDYFYSLKTGSKESNKLAKYIRKIDALFHKQGTTFKSRIRFDLKKHEALNNMSDLAFVLNTYLTGDKGVNLIQVAEVEDTED